MANPTVNSGITQSASLQAAMWISPDVDQSGTPTKGAWDAQNSVFWGVSGSSSDLTSEAMGTSGVNGLTVANGVDSGIFYESAANQTGNIWETYSFGPTTFVALVKQSANGCVIIQNRDGYSPREGFQLVVTATGAIEYYITGSSGTVYSITSAGQLSNGEVAIIALTLDVSGTDTAKIYKNGTLLQTDTGSTLVANWSGHSDRRAGSFDSSSRTGASYQSAGGSLGGLLYYSTVLSAAETQTFGTTGDLATAFYSAAFAGLVASAPVLSSPAGAPTGNTTATVGFTTDQAVSGALPAYFLTLPAATAAPADAATLIANGATVSQTTGGTTPTRALTGLTTNTAVRTHMCQPGSNVVSSASYTPPTMASSGSLAAQSGTASTAFTWTGATPESQITVQGVGSSAWTLTSAGGSGLSTINSSTGVPGGTLTATPGVYTVTVTKTDSSTAGTNPTGGGSPPQTIVRTISLTVSAAPGGPTINTHPTNQTAKIGATATFSASATASSGSLTAQWQKDAADISGANGTTSYARTGVVLADHGSAFRCGYSDAAGGPVYTNAAPLTVAVTFINGPVPAQSGAVGVAASWDFSSYFAGGLSRTFAILSGALPAGMSQVGSTAVFSGTPSAAGSGSMVVRATDSATNTDQTGTISWTISAALATTLSLTLTTDGTNPAANLTGLKVAVYDQPTPNLWAGQQPIYTTAAGTTNGSGVFTCSIAGLTTLAPGGIAGVAISNSDGTTTQGAAQRGYVGPVVVS